MSNCIQNQTIVKQLTKNQRKVSNIQNTKSAGSYALDGIMALHASASRLHGRVDPSRLPDHAFLADLPNAQQQRVFNDLHPRRRSVARRAKERLAFGVAALALFGLSVWIIPNESPGRTGSTDSPSVHRIEKSQDRVASDRPALAIQSTPTIPTWLIDVIDMPPPAPFGARRAQ